MEKTKFSFIIIIFYLLFNNCAAQQNINLDNIERPILIGHQIEYYEDATNLLNIDDILKHKDFKKSSKKVLNFNLTNSSIWLKINIDSNVNSRHFALDISSPLLDVLNVFKIDGSNKKLLFQYGDNFKFSNRKYLFSNYIIDVLPSNNSSNIYYFQMKNHEQFQIPIYLGSRDEIIKKNQFENSLLIIFITIILVMLCYNLFIYISVKDRSYLLYVLYILSIGITQIAIKGFGFNYLWPNNIWLQQHATYIFSAAVGVSSLAFFKNFIGLNNINNVYIKLINAIIGLYIFTAILSLFNIYNLSYLLLQILALMAVFVVLLACIKAIKNKVTSANFYLLAWVVFIIGIVLFVLKDFDIIPYNLITIYTMPAGSAIEVILLSFALANRIKKLQKDKEYSQLQLIEAAKEKERMVIEQNINLEKEVKQRTQELEIALIDLKRSEVELINKEKMSSLGVLTAGIAHEINNPINFVTSSIAPLKRDIKDILSLLSKYDDVKEFNFNSEKLLAIEKLKSDLDIDYLVEEINLLLDGIEEGAIRTAGIVRGLQKFSRSDEHIFRNADVIDGIENTLTLLNSQIKDRIKIIRIYKDLPLIYCSIGKLNQVFLNLISNSIYAVMHNNKNEKIIEIKTIIENNTLKLSIKDNGLGIEPNLLSKIFDPFFTTKAVGQGTGLGLAISQGIIHDHKGILQVESTLNVGSEFSIILPIIDQF